VGEGRVSATSVVQRIMAAHGGAEGATEDLSEVINPTRVSQGKARPQGDPGIVVDGDDDVWVKLARCCTPVPGDEVLGFVTRGHGVSVHRLDCVNVASLRQEPDRIVPVTWAPKATSVFLVNIQVEALDRSRLLSDVTRALSDQHVNILSASVSTTRDRIAISRFTFEMADATHLGSVLKSVRTVEGVYDVYRI
jgi:GTP pyrophosphokinase